MKTVKYRPVCAKSVRVCFINWISFMFPVNLFNTCLSLSIHSSILSKGCTWDWNNGCVWYRSVLHSDCVAMLCPSGFCVVLQITQQSDGLCHYTKTGFCTKICHILDLGCWNKQLHLQLPKLYIFHHISCSVILHFLLLQ